MTFVAIKNLKKQYGKNLVLDIESLELQKGRAYGFFGANGSGKSTLLKCLTSLIDYKGEIEIDGVNLKKNPKPLERIGLLIENPAFYNDLTGRKNIEYFCKDTSSIDEYAEILQVKDILGKKYRAYSLGMRQKLGILLACVKGKDLIVLDEPFNGLDVISVDNALRLINHCREIGVTVILTSHQLDVSQKAIDSIYLLKNCRIKEFIIPEKKSGEKFLFEFANKENADAAEKLIGSLSVEYERAENIFKINSQGKFTFYDMIDKLKPCEYIKAEDITSAVKELYLEMEKSV